MKKDTIDQLFETHEGSFDLHQTPEGHQKRFLERLNASKVEPTKQRNWWKPLSIAASIVVIIGLGFSLGGKTENQAELASVSPEMEQTQNFFTAAINEEIKKLKRFETPETKALVADALIQIEVLEKEYQLLKVDLVESGNDKRVIYAMIANFQNRIDLLENVVRLIEDVKNFKSDENEITI